jgi:hypothetical protein
MSGIEEIAPRITVNSIKLVHICPMHSRSKAHYPVAQGRGHQISLWYVMTLHV